MKKKIQSWLTIAAGILIVVGLLVVYNLLQKPGDREYRNRRAAVRMNNHNHLFMDDLFSLQAQSLSQIQATLGSNETPGQNSTWIRGNTGVSKAGYPFSLWDSYTPETKSDPYGYVNTVKCFDIAGVVHIIYSTNDPAYLSTAAEDLKRRNYTLKQHGDDSEGSASTYEFYTNQSRNMAVILAKVSANSQTENIAVITSIENAQATLDGTLNTDLH